MAVFNEVTAATVSGALAFGMVLSLLGSVKLALGRRISGDNANEDGIEVRVAWLVFAFNLALVPAMLLSGILLDSIQSQPLMAIGSALTAISLFTLAWTAQGKTDFRRAWLAIVVLGLGGACLSTSSIVLMPKAFFRGDPNQITAAITLGHVFIALGMLLMPVLADLLLSLIKFRGTLAVLGVLALAPLAIVFLTPQAEFDITKSYTMQPTRADLSAILTSTQWNNSALWAAALICFLYLPVEFSINTWATTLLKEHKYSDTTSNYLLSLFWLAFALSRLGAAALEAVHMLPRGMEPWLIMILGGAVAVCLGNLANSTKRGWAIVGLILLGVFMGPIFPTLVAEVFRRFSDAPQGTIYGGIYAVGALGSVLVSVVLRGIMDWRARDPKNHFAFRLTMYLPMVLAVILAASALLLAVTSYTPNEFQPSETPPTSEGSIQSPG